MAGRPDVRGPIDPGKTFHEPAENKALAAATWFHEEADERHEPSSPSMASSTPTDGWDMNLDHGAKPLAVSHIAHKL